MAAQLTIDQDVAAAMVNLIAVVKPYHDKLWTYALAADAQEMPTFYKWLRKRSHDKGEIWKNTALYLNDFITLTVVPNAPDYSLNANMAVPDILSGLLDDECQVRQAIEDVIAQARAANENRVILFLSPMVKSQAKVESKIQRLQILWTQLNGDAFEWQKSGF